MSGQDLSNFVLFILSGALLVPYAGWGIYTLRLRYRYHHDFTPISEAFTLLFVAIFFIVEMHLVRRCMGRMPLYYMFSILGLVVSSAALYGPMLVSALSRLLVDLLFPPEPSKTHEPRYAPAEALERDGDYEGAIREYTTIARIFPREPAAFLRIADLKARMDMHEEAAAWFERVIPLLKSPDTMLPAVNRLCEIYCRKLGRMEDGASVLTKYLDVFPDGDLSERVRARRERILREIGERQAQKEPIPDGYIGGPDALDGQVNAEPPSPAVG